MRNERRTSTRRLPATIAASLCLFLLAALLAPADAQPTTKPSQPEAREAAVKWLDRLGERGLVLNERIEEAGFIISHGPSAVGPVTTFTFQRPGWWITFAFRGDIGPGTPLKTLQDQFWYAALDRLPTPGLDLPGWTVYPQTPKSSFEKGVEVVSFDQGRIKLRVRTTFFALYGRDPSVLVPADAPAPPDSYFQIRRDFPLDLTIDGPCQAM